MENFYQQLKELEIFYNNMKKSDQRFVDVRLKCVRYSDFKRRLSIFRWVANYIRDHQLNGSKI